HDILFRVQRFGTDQHGRMMVGGVGLLADSDAFRVPVDGKLAGDPSQELVAGGVAPKDEVVPGNVGVGDVHVVLDAGFAAKLVAPVVGGVGQLGSRPGAHLFVHR